MSSKGAKVSIQVEPDVLIELAQSELGMEQSSFVLCELCWAIAAHCSARGHPGNWSLIEVPMFLDALEGGYAVQDLGKLVRLWVQLSAWMHDLGLLDERSYRAYRSQTDAWLRLRVRVGRTFEALLGDETIRPG